MYIEAVSKALTEHRYDQKELTDILKQVWETQAGARTLNRLEKFHESVQVKSRHLALPKKEYEHLDSFTKANQAFIKVGSQLATEALSDALDQTELEANDIDALFFTTVTGLAVPTIDARLMNRMELRRDVKRPPPIWIGLRCWRCGNRPYA
jgi:alkylresorcinol/alkylpyrone synthase